MSGIPEQAVPGECESGAGFGAAGAAVGERAVQVPC